VPAQKAQGPEFKFQYSKKEKPKTHEKPKKQNQNNLLKRLV
jgi:hypothetical protein